jgi:hypothetical protein
VRIEQVGTHCCVPQRQVLRNEVDVEQAAGQMLEVPRALSRRVPRDAVAHVGHVAHQRLGIAWPAAVSIDWSSRFSGVDRHAKARMKRRGSFV